MNNSRIVITRRKHKKSKLGCPQCKQKRSKCDEALPSCQNCRTRNIRCGYLDHSQEQILKILVAHWEADGSDPTTNPIQAQKFDPQQQVIVDEEKKPLYPVTYFVRPQHKDDIINDHSRLHQDHQVQIRRPTAPLTSKFNENDGFFSPFNHTFNSSLEDAYVPRKPVSITNLNASLAEEYSPFSVSTVSNSSTPADSLQTYPSYRIPLINHEMNTPSFHPLKFKEFCGESMAYTYSRALLLKRTHGKTVIAFTNMNLFKALLLYASASLLSSVDEVEVLFYKYKGECMKYVLDNLANVNDSNADMLLMLISALNSSSIFQKDISFKEHFMLASGPGSLLKEAYENPSKFPNSFQGLKIHADGILFTVRFMWLPQYDASVLWEFHEVLKEFGTLYIENEDLVNSDDIIVEQYESMVEFVEFCMDFLKFGKSDDHVISYPITKVYEMVQRWYSICPSECFTLNSKTSSVEKIFYSFWFTLAVILEAIVTGARYIFTYFLFGYVLLFPFDKSQLLKGLEDDKLKWYLNYSCRVIAFLQRRRPYIMRNTILNDPIPKFSNKEDRFKPRSLGIRERCITNFRTSVIKKINYPSSSMALENLIDSSRSPNYYGTSIGPSLDHEGQLNESPKEGIDISLSNSDESNSVDMLNDINPNTSLLNCDFDPRFTDPIFNERVLFQEADLEFIQDYVEDIRMILHMG